MNLSLGDRHLLHGGLSGSKPHRFPCSLLLWPSLRRWETHLGLSTSVPNILVGDEAQQWKQDSRATVCQKRHSLLCSWAQLNKANLKTHKLDTRLQKRHSLLCSWAPLNKANLKTHKLDAKLQDRHAAALLQAHAPSEGRGKATSTVVLNWSD